MKNKLNLDEINEKVLSVILEYQRLKTPYFINIAEQEYKAAMSKSGLSTRTINKVIRKIKFGETKLGAFGGKATPSEIKKDIDRVNLKGKPTSYIQMFHIGVDCSGLVFNALYESFSKKWKIKLINNLKWKTKIENEYAAKAGAFAFNSEFFETINSVANIQPLDLLIQKNHQHIGIVVKHNHQLKLAESSILKNGVILTEINKLNNWNNYIIKRMPYF